MTLQKMINKKIIVKVEGNDFKSFTLQPKRNNTKILKCSFLDLRGSLSFFFIYIKYF